MHSFEVQDSKVRDQQKSEISVREGHALRDGEISRPSCRVRCDASIVSMLLVRLLVVSRFRLLQWQGNSFHDISLVNNYANCRYNCILVLSNSVAAFSLGHIISAEKCRCPFRTDQA